MMRTFAFSLLFCVFFCPSANSADSISIVTYASQQLCSQSEEPDRCFVEIAPVVSHDYLYVYARVLSNKNALYPDWASYCKSRELPTFCMSMFERDYASFKVFVLDAVSNNNLAEKLNVCHQNLTVGSYIATLNKQCIYQ